MYNVVSLIGRVRILRSRLSLCRVGPVRGMTHISANKFACCRLQTADETQSCFENTPVKSLSSAAIPHLFQNLSTAFFPVPSVPQ